MSTAAAAVKERPIIFSAAMIKALLEGRKSQTRRIVKPQPVGGDSIIWDKYSSTFQCGRLRDSENAWREIRCPFGKPGDRLWVREATERYFLPNILTGEPTNAECGRYIADGAPVLDEREFDLAWWYSKKTCPPIHMPRWASRITLEITGVRVERLQDISEDDVLAEGIERIWDEQNSRHVFASPAGRSTCPREAFCWLWESIRGAGSWDKNPFLWVLEFRRVTPWVPSRLP